MANEASFSITLTGETTGEKWFGKFKAKTVLTHRDYLTKDRLRREYLGPNSSTADVRVVNTAIMASELAVRITDAPKWWQSSDNGLELADDNLVLKVFNEAIRVETEAAEAQKKLADEAGEEIKEKLAKDTDK
jgi:hypothetical protein